MAMFSSSEILVDGFCVCLDLVLKLIERIEGGFVMDLSEFGLLECSFLVIDRACCGGFW